jgi:hypothetical protein
VNGDLVNPPRKSDGLAYLTNEPLAVPVNAAPFAGDAIVNGLTINTAIWVDISLAAITSGTARLRDVSVSIVEIY